MHHFAYKDGALYAEDVPLSTIADAVGTPFYCYSTATLERHYSVFAEAFAGSDTLICYALKANSNLAVLKTLARMGAGMDVVSLGELERTRAAGISPQKVVFSGVGKTRDEIARALEMGIYAFNVESEPELNAISETAASMGATAHIAIRVNPDVDARTHAKISTGKAENKFGVPYATAPELYAHAAKLPGIKPVGVHMHIGSQITDLEPFTEAFGLLRELTERLRRDGHDIRFVNFGGGLGIPYRGVDDIPPEPKDYAATVRAAGEGLNCRLLFEPGRMIAGNAGILVTQVIYTKKGTDKTFTIVDAAMNDLIRPTLYEAYHDVWPLAERRQNDTDVITDLVGPVCETGDYLALERALPELKEGDRLAIMTAGAYGAVQAGTYNTRLLVPEVLVKGDQYSVIRPRSTYEALIGQDQIPDWLTET